MRKSLREALVIFTGVILVSLLGGTEPLLPGEAANKPAPDPAPIPIVIAHQGSSASLERPPVRFNHDLHTTALKQTKSQDCAVCHVIKQTDPLLIDPEVKVFKFPKGPLDETDKTAIMHAYHNECVNCHRKMSSEGSKSGPAIGLCGKCHTRSAEPRSIAWSWSPIFDYARHAKHLQAVEKLDPGDQWNIAQKVEVTGETTGKKCDLCHHSFDSAKKKLVYTKNTENSCRACHKEKDEKNARSMQKVAHSACIGCHMKSAEKVRAELAREGKTELTEADKKKFGPFECRGCHGEHKLTPDEISKIPRLVRGQKDVIDLSLVAPDDVAPQEGRLVSAEGTPPIRMKAVPFNHKAHEQRGQFCNTCHHHSLEKCVNCHTPTGDPKKGGGVSYERAFHRAEGKQACIGCHAKAKQAANCAGCHQWTQNGMTPSVCVGCHRGPTAGIALEVPPMPLVQDKEKVPEKVRIKKLEKEFKPAEMPHMKIVNKLISLSNGNALARWFHAGKEQAVYAGCHHRSELQQAAVKVPNCSTCHNRSFDPNTLGKPGLSAAYHRQCIGCHEAMNQKPLALECTKCHPAKEVAHTAGIIPPVSGDK